MTRAPEVSPILVFLDTAYDQMSWHAPNLRGSIRGITPLQVAWKASWRILFTALEPLTDADLDGTVTIGRQPCAFIEIPADGEYIGTHGRRCFEKVL